MLYHLNRSLFLENGATVLAERDRAARETGIAYHLLGTSKAAPRQAPQAPDLRTAA